MGKQEIKEKKYEVLDVDDNCTFRINIDVLNEALGVGRSMYVRACYPDKKDTYFTEEGSDNKYFIWMPKLYGNSSEWMNSISEDGSKMFEIAEQTKETDWSQMENPLSGKRRIVFAKPSADEPYRFVGVFEDDEMNYMWHSYKRVAKKIKLIGNPVYKIEIIS